MATLFSSGPGRAPRAIDGFMEALRKQREVIGALLMRELHTRYGRENVGYLWMIGEPLMLGTVIGLIHTGNATHNGHNNGDMKPVAFAVLGYTIFIMFRGIVNRSEGTVEANAPLLYHKMVTILDVTIAKALLEAAGTFLSFFVLMSMIVALGQANLPVRPLELLGGIFYIFWLSVAQSLIIVGGTYQNRLLERLVHPYSYFMVPLSGAFFQVKWLPHPYREWIQYNPMVSAFELLRYGWFGSAKDDYVHYLYVNIFAMVLTVLGLYACKDVKNRVHA